MSKTLLTEFQDFNGLSGLIASWLPSFRKFKEKYLALLQQYKYLSENEQKLLQKIQQLEERYNSLESLYQAQRIDLSRTTKESTTLRTTLSVLLQQKTSLLSKVEEARINLRALNESKDELQTALDRLLQKKDRLVLELDKIKIFLRKSRENEKIALEKIKEAEVEYNALSTRYNLVSSALSAPLSHSPRYLEFSKILNEQFLPFTNNNNVLANEAEITIRFKAIEGQVRLIESLSRFKNKTIVAVSGGFSSGKSSFISSLFSDTNIRLPIGVQPITAIPTYVVHSSQNRTIGYTKKGGEIDIPTDIYSQLSHEFVRKFGFNLRDLLPFIALETPLEEYQNISFIDLPGYNPGDREGFTVQDESSAAAFMTQAQCILWVIGLDSNGTISRADIDFLRDHLPSETKLYIILNKADLRPRKDVERIIQEVVDMLIMDGVTYEGISAYSSESQEEIYFENKSLREILSEWNKPKNSYDMLLFEINSIFEIYEKAFINDIKTQEEKISIIKSLELDLYQLGLFEEQNNKLKTSPRPSKDARLYLSDLRKNYDVKERKRQLEELQLISRNFVEVLSNGFIPQK